MRFLVDACLDVRVADWLRSEGHDAIHLRDEGLHKLPDAEVFQKAIAEQRVIATADLDFGEIVALTHGQLIGVVLLRLRNPRVQHVIDRLTIVLPQVIDQLETGAIVIVEEARYRVRQMPITHEP